MAFTFHPNFLLHPDFHGATLEKRYSSLPLTTEIQENVNNHTCNNGEDHELSDDGDTAAAGEKKRRLNTEQVKMLEKNFELGNKLDSDRKVNLARALGLQPRQVAIWFQNRRARWKTKQLEKDYEILKLQFDAVKSENYRLQAQNQKLHAEISALKNGEPTESINLNKETEGSCSNTRSENNSEFIKLHISRSNNPAIDSPSSSNPGQGVVVGSSLRGGGVAQAQGQAQQLFPKMEQVAKEGSSLSNVFCGMDVQTGFWPWLDQQHLN